MRPLILGWSNPYSDDPLEALSPFFPRSSGENLWRMVNVIDPDMTRNRYMRTFDRANVATMSHKKIVRMCDRPHVFLLGTRVTRKVLGSGRWKSFGQIVVGDTTYTMLPHPSGLTLLYNDHLNRQKVGHLLLASLRSQ